MRVVRLTLLHIESKISSNSAVGEIRKKEERNQKHDLSLMLSLAPFHSRSNHDNVNLSIVGCRFLALKIDRGM